MEEDAINTPDSGRQKAKVDFPCSSSHSSTIPSLEFQVARDTSTTLNTGTSHGESVQIDISEPCPKKISGKWTLDIEYSDPSRRLLHAAIKGDWPAAKAFLKENGRDFRTPITKEKATVFHIAAASQHTTFITKMLKLIKDAPEVDLAQLKTTYGFTALHSAAQSGNVRIAQQLVKMNKGLLSIPDGNEDIPLIVAAYHGHTKMVSYLFDLTGLEHLTNAKRIELLEDTIDKDMFDVALEILNKDQNIATAGTELWFESLKKLARKPFAIGSESQLSFWKSLLKYSWFNNKALMKTLAHQLVDKLWERVGTPEQFPSNLVNNSRDLIFEAAKVGNVEFLIILARSYPELICERDEDKMSIFHIAILYRQESVFNLIFEIGADKDTLASCVTPRTKENMLHLAGKLPPLDRLNIVSGAALQMQRELLWFKEIEKIVPQSYVNRRNSRGQTPKEVFIKTHKNLQKNGEKWMKDTANYCMIVATLIATVIFAASFTIPGGSNQETGIPIFFRSKRLMIFFISDAITLCSSSTSIVIFLSILTSRYIEEDFFKSLPLKLVFGLVTLFISMAGMMVAFIATSFLVFSSAGAWVPFVVITLASIPVALFVQLHRTLCVDTFLSIYKSRFLFRPYKHRLF